MAKATTIDDRSAVKRLPFGKAMLAIWGVVPDVTLREKRTLSNWSGLATPVVSNWNSNTNSCGEHRFQQTAGASTHGRSPLLSLPRYRPRSQVAAFISPPAPGEGPGEGIKKSDS
ncbi:MAG: hypothetical protein ACT4QB_13935 [Gammaproteobacteria bacterium]